MNFKTDFCHIGALGRLIVSCRAYAACKRDLSFIESVIIWIPIGSPFENPNGTEIAGIPVKLAVTVLKSIRNSAIGSSIFSPNLNGIIGTVGDKRKSNFLNDLLTTEEKRVIRIIEENNGEITQSDLVKKSQLSKLKISRIIKKLEQSKIVEKIQWGLTNKIRII